MDGYIKKSDAVDVIVKYPYNISGKTATAIKMIEDLPDADVVPKSEVDWNSIPVDVSEALKQRAVEKAKTEVASEIFEEIERVLDNHHYADLLVGEIAPISYYDAELEDALAELKKKYIGG